MTGARRIGRFSLTGVLGAGTSATVYLGRDRDGTAVAVKLLDRPGAVRAQLLAEAVALRSVHEPHCVRVIDVVDEDGVLALVTEYVESSPLAAVVSAAGRLSGPQALGVLRGALLGLGAVHRAGLVHGDVKPANILISRRGEAMLIDFGLVRTAGAANGITGSPAYMSPEQIRGDPVDARSDVYACGAVLFELLTGRRPYVAETVEATMRAHLDRPVPDARAEIGDAPAAVCRTALAKDPADRYPTAAAFLTALEDAARQRYGAAWLTGATLGGAGAGAGSEVAKAVAAPARSRHAGAWLAASGTVVAAGIVAVILTTHSSTPQIRSSNLAARPVPTGVSSTRGAATTTGTAVPTNCSSLCVTSQDGMVYRVTAVRRFTDPSGEPTVAVGFAISNTSSTPHVFEPFGGGFGATLTQTPDVQYTGFRGAERAGDPRCYTGSILFEGPTNAPQKIAVQPGATVAVPRQMCFVAPGGQKLKSVAFIDDEASTNSTVAFDPPR